jgi:hypothetical protein
MNFAFEINAFNSFITVSNKTAISVRCATETIMNAAVLGDAIIPRLFMGSFMNSMVYWLHIQSFYDILYGCGNCIIKSFKFVLFTRYCKDGQIMEYEVGRVGRTHVVVSLMERYYSENLGVDGRAILRWILRNSSGCELNSSGSG